MISWRQSRLRVLLSSDKQNEYPAGGNRGTVAAVDATDIHARVGGNMGKPIKRIYEKGTSSQQTASNRRRRCNIWFQIE